MTWVTSQSVWVLVFGCLAIALGIALLSRVLVLNVMSPTERDDAHAIAAALMTAFAAAFVLLTALTLANEVNSLSSDQSIVSNEAADAATVAWSSTDSGVNTVVMQRALYDYLVATAHMSGKEPPPRTETTRRPTAQLLTWNGPCGDRLLDLVSARPRVPSSSRVWTR